MTYFTHDIQIDTKYEKNTPVPTFYFLHQLRFCRFSLTSTDFYKAYMDVPMVQEASLSKGSITNKIMDLFISTQIDWK